jgi:hypothetical protein
MTFRSNGTAGEVSEGLAEKILKFRKESLGIRAQQPSIAAKGKRQ